MYCTETIVFGEGGIGVLLRLQTSIYRPRQFYLKTLFYQPGLQKGWRGCHFPLLDMPQATSGDRGHSPSPNVAFVGTTDSVDTLK